MEKSSRDADRLRERIEGLIEKYAEHPDMSEASPEAIEELMTTLEELQTAEEELQSQNEALALSREEVERERKRYQDLFELAPDPFVVTTTQGVIREVNRAAAEYFRTPSKYLIGKPFVIFIREGDRQDFYRAIKKLSSSHIVMSLDLNLKPREGRSVTMMTTATGMKGENEEQQILWMMKDISRSRRSEQELRRANEELERYARTVSHDLKGPLAGILLGADFMQESIERLPDGDERRDIEETVAAIENNARVAYALVIDLLLQANASDTEHLESDIDVAEQIEKVLQNEALFEGRDVEVEVEGDLGSVRASSTNVYQVFSNLIGNAVRHNRSPRPKITIKALGDTGDGQMRFLVSDNGPGISSSTVLRLTECLRTGERGEGLGIGLGIVCEILRRYNGSLRAYNDAGARVEFSLPSGSLKAVGVDDTRERNLRVLVVEDEPGTAYMIGKLLRKKLGSEVEVAGDLSAARRMLGLSYFDIVTLDYKLPDGTGLELLEEISEKGGHPPAIVLTGRGDEKTASQSFMLGAAGYVVKDEMIASALPEAIRRALQKVK